MSRIGSTAQSELMKNVSIGIKNELTYYRKGRLSDLLRYKELSGIFKQDLYYISMVELSVALMLYYREGSIGRRRLNGLVYVLGGYGYYLLYIIAIVRNIFSYGLYSLLLWLVR